VNVYTQTFLGSSLIAAWSLESFSTGFAGYV